MDAGRAWFDRRTALLKKFVVRSVAQFVKGRQIRHAVSVAAGAVNHRVDALAIIRLCEAAPRAVGVYVNRAMTVARVHVLQSGAAETARSQVLNTRSAYIVCALAVTNRWTCCETEKSLAISTPNIFRPATARDFWQRRGLCNPPSPAPAVGENHLARLFAIQPEVVHPVRPRLNVDQFGMTRGFVTGWDD